MLPTVTACSFRRGGRQTEGGCLPGCGSLGRRPEARCCLPVALGCCPNLKPMTLLLLEDARVFLSENFWHQREPCHPHPNICKPESVCCACRNPFRNSQEPVALRSGVHLRPGLSAGGHQSPAVPGTARDVLSSPPSPTEQPREN